MGVGSRSRFSREDSLLVFLPLLTAAALLACVSIPTAHAVGIGVNKATIDYTDVLQNGYAQDTILVTTDSPDPIDGTWQVEGDIAPWVRIEPPDANFTFSQSAPYPLTVVVEPPADARLMNYTGGIRVLTGQLARTEGGKIGTTTRAAFLIKLNLGVTGTQHLSCVAGGVQIKDTEIGQPFDFLATVHNTGNVRIRPSFSILVYDQYQTKLVANLSVATDQDILPTTTENILKSVMHNLPPGQYWAQVTSAPCGDSAFITFDILDRGGIADQGELLGIDVNPWAKTGDIVPITARFRNEGSRTENAKFKGTVTSQATGQLVKVIDTDSYSVAPGQTVPIETYFNPTDPGQYIIAGRILYNDKLTFQKSAILNVQGPSMVPSGVSWWLILLLIVIIILILLILIARKRRRRGWAPSTRTYHRRILR